MLLGLDTAVCLPYSLIDDEGNVSITVNLRQLLELLIEENGEVDFGPNVLSVFVARLIFF